MHHSIVLHNDAFNIYLTPINIFSDFTQNRQKSEFQDGILPLNIKDHSKMHISETHVTQIMFVCSSPSRETPAQSL